jgi:transposase
MIGFSLKHIECMEGLLSEIDRQIDEVIEKNGLREVVELLDTIPGVDKGAGKAIIAEIGADMSKFPTEKHLASWGGMSPGNNESAGKKKSGKTSQGNKWLKSIPY